MKSLFFAFSWLLLSVGVAFVIIASVSFYKIGEFDFLKDTEEQSTVLITQANSGNDTAILGATTIVETDDARALLIANFLKRYNTGNRNIHHPLVPEDYFGKFFVSLADKYNLDFRLLPAIAMQESNLCNHTPKPKNEAGVPVESYNCLGFGVYGTKVTMFPSFEANFEQAAKTLKKNYIDIGLDTPYKIMKKYTPPSDGSWAESVNQWMAEMRYDDRSSGIKLKEDADLLEFTEASSEASQSAK
ncbi:glucosaminidase domain-containing protein [Candidatus Woesebacteria bacterium]|nr:glucosaminidase domain-containing protein [Candidatus Woesebacteria bacterium]